MGRALTDAGPETEFWQQLRDYDHSAWRFEQQRQYDIGYEETQLRAFLDGHPESPMENPELGAWMRQVAAQTRAGKTIGRVRIVDTPITDYQRWMAWMDRWNTEAGEQIDYLLRSMLNQLPPAPFGDTDWWLLDEGTSQARVMIMHFDECGYRRLVELETDPAALSAASEFRRRVVSLSRRQAERPAAR
ncbi:DUF6879 family protein [Krasilnikovia sp. MM14-A1259]|uniref:DUF6879 family protein n=1 Tax=Krasilnikovia sp. MM14-A1259 TaxID=3373539 RepID=UPI003813AEF6